MVGWDLELRSMVQLFFGVQYLKYSGGKNEANKVLFAEANKDSVDFLFGLLALPIGTVVKLLTKESMVGSMGRLYKSVESLDSTYLISNMNKLSILNPKTLNQVACNNRLLPNTAINKLYRCSKFGHSDCKSYVTDTTVSICPKCGGSMSKELEFVESDEGKNVVGGGTGFVKGVVTYTVMDDLSVTPMSTISSLTMLSKFQVKDVGLLVEAHVDLDIKQGLKLLKASLQSKTVLTDVFLRNKK